MYNKRDVFNQHIKKKMDEFAKECSLRGVPMFVTCAIEDTEDKTIYESDMVSAITNDITLNEDKIVKMANVLNGFDVVERDKTPYIEM